MPSVQTETCANCGTTIGALETPYLWKQQTVCAACYARLSKARPVEDAHIPDSEFNVPLNEQVKRSTWTPERGRHTERMMRPKNSTWGKAAGAGFIALALGILGMALADRLGETVGTGGMFLAILGGLVVWVCILYWPIVVAEQRRHSSISAIKALVALSLFIPILWIVALVWAYMTPDPK